MPKVDKYSATRITLCVSASAIDAGTPRIYNLMAISIFFNVSSDRALALGAFPAATGVIISMLSRGVILLLYLAYQLYSVSNTVGIVRNSLLATIVALQERASVLAFHALMTLIRALINPVIWFLTQNHRNNIRHLHYIVSDNFIINYIATVSALLILLFVALISLQYVVPIPDHSKTKDNNIPHRHLYHRPQPSSFW